MDILLDELLCMSFPQDQRPLVMIGEQGQISK